MDLEAASKQGSRIEKASIKAPSKLQQGIGKIDNYKNLTNNQREVTCRFSRLRELIANRSIKDLARLIYEQDRMPGRYKSLATYLLPTQD